MKNVADVLPKAISNMYNGTYAYRWNIKSRGLQEDMNKEEYVFDEVFVLQPVTANKITKAVINEVYGVDLENKMLNDYNAYALGVLDESYKVKYTSFLNDRKALKEEIDRQCRLYGLPEK